MVVAVVEVLALVEPVVGELEDLVEVELPEQLTVEVAVVELVEALLVELEDQEL